MKLLDRLKSAFTPFIGMKVGKRSLHDMKVAYADALRDHVMQEGIFIMTADNSVAVEIPDVIIAEFSAKKFDLNV